MRRLWTALALIGLIGLVGPIGSGPPPARAVEPDEILADPVLEARARALSKELRCLVCQNESIDSSNADLARDLRLLVRERLMAGDSDDAVRAFMVARYGDFVLLDPPVNPRTYLLWFGPILIVLLGAAAVWVAFAGRRGGGAAPLDAEEAARLDRLLKDPSIPPGA